MAVGNLDGYIADIDPSTTATYYNPMAKKHPNSNTEQNLKQLEAHIDRLIEAYDRLREENRRLRTEHKAHADERARLIEKHDSARTKVEQMLNRVKSMEDLHE